MFLDLVFILCLTVFALANILGIFGKIRTCGIFLFLFMALFVLGVVVAVESDFAKDNPFVIVNEEPLVLKGSLSGRLINLKSQQIPSKIDFFKEPGVYREWWKWARYTNPKSLVVIFYKEDTVNLLLFGQLFELKGVDTTKIERKNFGLDNCMLRAPKPRVKKKWLAWEWQGKGHPKEGHLVEYYL